MFGSYCTGKMENAWSFSAGFSCCVTIGTIAFFNYCFGKLGTLSSNYSVGDMGIRMCNLFNYTFYVKEI